MTIKNSSGSCTCVGKLIVDEEKPNYSEHDGPSSMPTPQPVLQQVAPTSLQRSMAPGNVSSTAAPSISQAPIAKVPTPRPTSAAFTEMNSIPLSQQEAERRVAPSTRVGEVTRAPVVQQSQPSPRYAPVKAPVQVKPVQQFTSVKVPTSVPSAPQFAPVQITVPLKQTTPVFAAVQTPTPPPKSEFTSATQQSLARAEPPQQSRAPPKSHFLDQNVAKRPQYAPVKRTLG